MSGAPDDPNVHPKPSDDSKKKLQRLIEAVRLPAGSDPRFVTGTVDATHRDEFTAAVHRTWKDVQAEIIQEIVTIESLLARPEASRMPPGSADWLRYLCRIARRVNDAVAWIMIGQPETVKLLCCNHVRPTLIDPNPASVAAVLDDINKDPHSIAIWNDATTFLDVGDITARRSEKPGELSFIELKAGDVNLAVLKLHEAMRKHRRAGQPEKSEEALDEFYKAHGRKGFQQLMRVTKQLMRDTGVMGDFNAELARTADTPRDVEVERGVF